MRRGLHLRLPRLHRQRGVAGIAIVLLLLSVMAVVVMAGLSITRGVARDAAGADDRVQATFLAESGLERGIARFMAGTACGAALAEPAVGNPPFNVAGAGTFTISAGQTTDFSGATALGATSDCRIRATGMTNAGSVRALEVIASLAPTTNTTISAKGTQVFSHTVAPGTDLVVIGISWITEIAPIATVATVTFQGQTLLAAAAQVNSGTTITPSQGVVSSQFFYLKSPISGTYPVSVNMTNSVILPRFFGAGFNFTGTDPISPIAATGGSGNVAAPGGIMTSTTSTAVPVNAFILDLLGHEKSGQVTLDVQSGCSPRAVFKFQANQYADGSYCGPVTAAGTVSLSWKWNQSNKPWSHSIVALRAASVSGSGTKIRSTGGGISQWRDVVIMPP